MTNPRRILDYQIVQPEEAVRRSQVIETPMTYSRFQRFLAKSISLIIRHCAHRADTTCTPVTKRKTYRYLRDSVLMVFYYFGMDADHVRHQYGDIAQQIFFSKQYHLYNRNTTTGKERDHRKSFNERSEVVFMISSSVYSTKRWASLVQELFTELKPHVFQENEKRFVEAMNALFRWEYCHWNVAQLEQIHSMYFTMNKIQRIRMNGSEECVMNIIRNPKDEYLHPTDMQRNNHSLIRIHSVDMYHLHDIHGLDVLLRDDMKFLRIIKISDISCGSECFRTIGQRVILPEQLQALRIIRCPALNDISVFRVLFNRNTFGRCVRSGSFRELSMEHCSLSDWEVLKQNRYFWHTLLDNIRVFSVAGNRLRGCVPVEFFQRSLDTSWTTCNLSGNLLEEVHVWNRLAGFQCKYLDLRGNEPLQEIQITPGKCFRGFLLVDNDHADPPVRMIDIRGLRALRPRTIDRLRRQQIKIIQ